MTKRGVCDSTRHSRLPGNAFNDHATVGKGTRGDLETVRPNSFTPRQSGRTLRGRPSPARLLEARQQVTKMAGAAQPRLTVTEDRPGHFTPQQPERTPESAHV